MLLLANEDTKINIVDSSFKFLNAPDYNTMLDTVETAYRNQKITKILLKHLLKLN